MSFQEKVIKSLTALVIINAVLLVYGAVILIDSGHWQALRFGMGAIVMSRLVLPIGMLPGVILIRMMGRFLGRRPLLAHLLFLSSFAWFISLLTGFSFFAVWILHEGLHGPLVWGIASWGIASGVAPWVMLALSDRGNHLLITMLWILMFASSVMVWALSTGIIEFGMQAWLTSWCVMAICLIWQSLYVNRIEQRLAAAVQPATTDAGDTDKPVS